MFNNKILKFLNLWQVTTGERAIAEGGGEGRKKKDLRNGNWSFLQR
jgi:hypothetical protein